MNRRSILGLSALGIGLALVGMTRPMLVWNASASAPIGLYLVVPIQPQAGELALVEPPDWVQSFADRRGYLPAHVPLVKRIVAQADGHVCAVGGWVFINGWPLAKPLEHDSQGRSLPRWNDCRRLSADEVFLLMANVSDSFDSRYFGPVKTSSIIGRLEPLWTK